MKRKDKEINDRVSIDRIIAACDVCHLGLARGDEPYVVPVSFGYDGAHLYIHTAKEGRKLDFFAANPQVCFQMERDVRIEKDDSKACKWTFRFESVVGYGKIEELIEPSDKSYGRNRIMAHYSDREWPFEPHELDSVRVWRISVDSITGKRSI